MGSFQYIEQVSYQIGLVYDSSLKVWSKPSGNNAYDSAVFSNYYINSALSDQSVRFRINETNKRRAGGFASRNRNRPDLSGEFMIEVTDTGVIRVLESGTIVFTYGTAVSVDDELRVQIIFETGIYKVKYWWREDDASAEQLMYTSAISSANITNKFPLHAKGEFYSVGATLEILSIEENAAGTNTILQGDLHAGDVEYSTNISEITYNLSDSEMNKEFNVSPLTLYSMANTEGQIIAPPPLEGQIFPLGDNLGL